MTPDKVYELLESYESKTHFIKLATVGRVLEMELIGREYCRELNARSEICARVEEIWDMGQICTNIYRYCIDRYIILERTCSLNNERNRVSKDFEDALCDRPLEPNQVAELLKAYAHQTALIDLSSVQILLQMEEIKMDNCLELVARKTFCGLVRHACKNVVDYCDARLLELEQFCKRADQ